jgi:hypothetical protein
MNNLFNKIINDGIAIKYDNYLTRKKEDELKKSKHKLSISNPSYGVNRRVSRKSQSRGSKFKNVQGDTSNKATIVFEEEVLDEEKNLMIFNPLKFLSRELMLSINKSPFDEETINISINSEINREENELDVKMSKLDYLIK